MEAEEKEEIKEQDVVSTEETAEDAENIETAAETAEEMQEESPSQDEEGEEETENEEEKGSKFFRKDKKPKKDKKDIQIEELTDKYKRTMAEFDNFRKRTEKEKAAMYEIGAKDIVEKILPIVDNFERGLQGLTEEEKAGAFADGMDKVYKQMIKALEEAGVKPIEAVGCEFDPNLHNAVMHIDDETLGENIVAEEFQKGYMYRDSVVRHSMVKVAN
ncbi:MAG: nucleotide exchange factor GrpE [Alistipes sp.]|nr:nucleotide exchange factor GrpE [Alistipes sp.]